MSNDTVMTVTVKGVGDFSDVVSNVGSVQKALTKLKLPDKLGDNLSKNITSFYKEYEKYQKKISEGIKTQGDYNQVEKSLNNMRNLYQAIGKDAQKLTELDMKDMLNLDTGEFKKIMDEMTSVMKQIGSVKIDTTPFTKAFKDIQGVTKNSKIVGEDGLLNKIIGHINTGQITEAKKQLQELQNYAKKVAPRTTADGKQAPGTLSPEKYQQLTSAINSMNGAVTQAETAINPLIEKHNNLQKELDETKQKAAQGIEKEFKGYNQASGEVEKLTDSLRRMHEEEFNFNREAQNIDRQIQSYFGLSQMIRKVGDIAKDAFATVKELDKAMTETAVVTNFSVGDMWDMLPTYTAQANQLGSTIKDVYEAATLYYQQGLNTNQAMGLANETLKMARIAGLGAAEATDMMTAALRGFNMEINQQSAQKINDIYSELAAITASDTAEIGSAMERTASIANSANMEFATTSAFLAQMIETTREAPENLGTAMKTIVARFQEMKQDPTKLIDSEGVAMDANKVDKALKTIGVNLMNTKGEFRDLDDVFLDISSRWDSLTQGQQRYIATIAAGSRQQSRFIAMMSNYERTMELVDAANNSAGASQRQFEKTLDSMEAKLNKLKNAWDQFTMGLMNNQILKFGVDVLTEGFTIVNKFIDILGKIPPKPFEGVTKSILTLITTLGMLNLGKKGARGLVMGGAAWWKGEEGGFGKNFMSGFSGKAAKAGTTDGQIYAQNFNNAIKKGQLKDALNLTKNRAKILSAPVEYENTFQGAFGQFSAKELSMGWSSQIETEIRDAFTRASASVNASIWGEEDGNEYIEGLITKMRSGEISAAEAANSLHLRTQGQANITDIGVNALPTKEVDQLSNSLTKAGSSLQSFGLALQDTPLAPFGAILSKIGMLTSSFGESAGKAMTIFKNGMRGTAIAEAEVGAGATVMAAGEATATTATTGLIGGIQALWAALLESPLFPIIAALAGLVIAYKLLDAAIITNKEQLEAATDAAAAASEAYDSAKQETSELSDAIEQVKANEDAFDGLVVGTAAFNEQLVTANDQIMELIKKYPMLNDYLTTDKNGLMHISNEGLNAVKDYQKQLQANASALNLIQAADLNSVEAQQKAMQMRKTKGTDTLESLAQRKQEADLVEQQAEAQQQMAKLNAVNTALVDKEIGNREKVSAILADQYDSRRKAISLEGESIHDLKQEYADFYGYKYDKSTKKITDIEGNEIDVDKATIKDAVKDIRVLTDIEVDGKSLDNAINHIDNSFSKALGEDFEDSGHLFSDILSDNINIEDDLLQNLLINPDKLQNAVDSLSEKEIAAVLGVSADAVEQAPDKYKDELTDKLTEKATHIAETQAQSYADLASMLAQTMSSDINQLISESGQFTTQAQVHNQQAIKEQLEKLTSEQKNTLSSVGSLLSENAGAETMRTFIKQATDIYTKGTKESITALDTIIKDVNWSSPTARLKAYNDMINSTDKDVQNLGNSLRNSSESSNLLGEAFEEFYDSSDFQEMAENMDKFADSSGKLNASSIQEMAKECNSLNNLLDTGAISAGGVAAALNAMGKDGNITILDLNENLLKFLSTANQLDDVLSEAHSLIENFDWGIDTGESEDFAKESTKKWKELYDNGEFGNQQLENYAKFVLGQERWNKELEKSGGNIETALNNMSGDILKYSDGFEQAWVDMADSSAKKYQDVHYGENGDIIWDTNGKTTQELVDWLAETRGITQEWAKLMVEDFANYSYDFKTELAENDFAAALKNGDYIEAHKGADNTTNITQSEVAALAAAQNKTEAEILKDIQKYGKISEDELNVIKNIDENGNLLMGNGDIASLNTQYSQAELGKDTDKSWISQYTAQTRQGEIIEGSTDLKAAISAAIADGFQSEQATEMARAEAYEAFKNGAQVFYDGVELNEKDLEDSQAFAEKIAEITENSRWNAVGEAIAQGYISYIQGTENPNSNTNPNTTNDYYNKSSKEGSSASTNLQFSDGAQAETDLRIQMREKARENWKSIWEEVKSVLSSGEGAEDPKIAAAEQSKENWKAVWEEVKSALSSGEGIEDPKVEAAKKAQENWKNIWNGVKQAFTSTPTSDVKPKQPTQPQSQQSTVGPQETTLTVHTEDSELDATKAKIDSVIQAASQPQTLTITANTGKSTNIALNSINKIKDATKKSNTIKVNAQVKGKDDVNNLSTIIKNVKAKTVKVSASVSGASKVTSLKNEISNLKNKDVYITTHKKTVKEGSGDAKGRNNKLPNNHLPNLGSLAKGSRHGRLGPKGKGGLTLTGEKGYEIAWLPNESRSMILGVDGPQMINLPADAVVYTHEQSEDILKKRQEIDAGSHAGRHRKNNKGSGKGKGKSNKKPKKKNTPKPKKPAPEKAPKTNQWSFEEVVRFDIDQNLLKLTSELNRLTKDIDKNLKKIGITADNIGDKINQQTDNLKAQLDYHQKELESYQRQQTDMGNFNAKISYNAGGKKDKEATIKFSDYMTQNADGIWVINEAAVQAAGNIAKQEAIYNAINGKIKEINDGIWKEQDTIYDLQNQIEDNAKKVAEAFYLWENELTEVYDLSQQIAAQTAMQDRFSSQVALELARLNTGFGDTAQSIAIITKANERNNQTLLQQIQTQKTMIEARERELDAFTTGTDELERLLAFRNAKVGTGKGDFSSQEVKDQAIAAAEQRLKAVEIARDYFVGKGPTKNQDGSLTYSIDWAKFNQDALSGQLSEETAKSVKDYFEKLNSANVDYNNAIKENTDTIKVAYDKLKEYQDYIVDFEDTLLQQLDDQLQQEIDNAEKLSSSITTSLKDLLDEVKRKLDERRKQEDNAKTERDISQKQQRLAALRADTSGGHQVEIAQLQKEIAEAQQSYGRTLEDQLLDRLQQQGDEAARQRERQIELAQAQLNISNSNNKELVNMWLKDPIKYKEEIKAAWMEAQDYESKGLLAQKQLNNTFNSSFAELAQATEEIKVSPEGTIATITDVITGFGDTINTQPDSQISFQEQVTNALASMSTALSGQNNPLQDVAYHNTQSGTNKQGSVDVVATQSLKDKGAKREEVLAAGVNKGVVDQVYGEEQTKKEEPKKEEILSSQTTQPTIDPKQTYMDRLKEIKKLKANNVKSSHVNELFDLGAKAGYGKASVLLHLVDNTGGTDPFSWSNIFKAIINAKGIDRYNLVKTWPNGNGTLKAALATLGNPDTLSEIKKHKNYKKATALTFKTGGLADYTGPAWLDGTPSKPELVLNSTDTKNFLVLRDVLSSAMNSMNTVSNSYGGDTLYEININVDKIEKDYDVDRVVEKVKKEITKGAGYRNVTQVRNLR